MLKRMSPTIVVIWETYKVFARIAHPALPTLRILVAKIQESVSDVQELCCPLLHLSRRYSPLVQLQRLLLRAPAAAIVMALGFLAAKSQALRLGQFLGLL